MAVPFRLEPESNDPPTETEKDALLEFDSEHPADHTAEALFHRPSDRLSQRSSLQDLLTPPEPPTPMSAPAAKVAIEPPRTSALSPSLTFALGVAGLVTATVAFYQMGQMLAGRSAAPAAVTSGGAPPTDAPTLPAPTTGQLEVTSDPSGAPVTVDGRAQGSTPLKLASLKPGRHEVAIGRGPTAVKRTVQVTAGSTMVVTAVLGKPAAAPTVASAPAVPRVSGPVGWVTFDAPIDLRILDGGRPRGSTRGTRLPLQAGTHELELVNDTYEVRQFVSAEIVSGRASRVRVPIPSGLVSLNALPWADVWIDGTPIGTTPLANISVPVGTHEVVWRHPTLGERTQTLVVKARTPARIGVNLNR